MSKSSTTTRKGGGLPVNRLPPIHPGEILGENLDEIGLSARAFAALVGVPHNRIAAILRGERAISADTAIRIGHYFGTGPKLWLNLQQSHDLKLVEIERGPEIRAAISPRAA